ncbi:hypothetical protein J4Q44_G00125300 [Coregonus suidteri]|uniref:Uncharacterized protein n=1 Tax=Coregonus suidteri TaxID=861788 RepID=A0AAN8LR18_9TELE
MEQQRRIENAGSVVLDRSYLYHCQGTSNPHITTSPSAGSPVYVLIPTGMCLWLQGGCPLCALQTCRPCLSCAHASRLQKANCTTTGNAVCGDSLPG